MKALPILDERATGIDVGSESLHVSIGGGAPKVTGTMTSEVQALVAWLVQQGVRSVALEATGVYWLYLYEALEAAGIEVLVVNGRHVRNLPGRKSDMSDCQWLATLHAHGLLRSGFVPPADIRRLRDYIRLRQDHISMAASHVQHMQKALERMNIKLHDTISSLTSVSGLKVIRAILAGQRDPQRLLALCDAQIRRNKAERVRESLRGTWRPEHLFALEQALRAWEFYQELIAQCDKAVEQQLHELARSATAAGAQTGGQDRLDGQGGQGGPDDRNGPGAGGNGAAGKPGKGKPASVNTPRIDGLHRLLLQVCGNKDATQLPGMAEHSLLQVIAEVGVDLSKWPTQQHFTAWSGLAPAAAQSGKRRTRQARHRNRTGELFCTMARSLARSVDKGFGGFYRRLKARRGGLVANKALARKLAAMFWQIMVHGTEYVERGLRQYEERVKLTEQRLLNKLAAKLNCQVVPKINDLAAVPG